MKKKSIENKGRKCYKEKTGKRKKDVSLEEKREEKRDKKRRKRKKGKD